VSTSEPPIACTLDAAQLGARLDAWQGVLDRVSRREPIDGGLRLTFAGDVPIAAVAELARDEHACCRFFSFAITVDERGTALEVTAPPEAAELLTTLFGDPGTV
jgi:hypothetical protein